MRGAMRCVAWDPKPCHRAIQNHSFFYLFLPFLPASISHSQSKRTANHMHCFHSQNAKYNHPLKLSRWWQWNIPALRPLNEVGTPRRGLANKEYSRRI